MEPIVLKFPERSAFTDDELFDFCIANDWFHIERDKHGQLIIMSPSGGTTGTTHFKIYRALVHWYDAHENKGILLDSSVGFRLPDKSVLAPDAAFVLKERWDALTHNQREKFPPLCPDFVIELKSESDSIDRLKNKMLEYIENGCRLGFLIIPEEKKVYVYKPDRDVIEKSTNEKISGEDVMPGFELDLSFMNQLNL